MKGMEGEKVKGMEGEREKGEEENQELGGKRYHTSCINFSYPNLYFIFAHTHISLPSHLPPPHIFLLLTSLSPHIFLLLTSPFPHISLSSHPPSLTSPSILHLHTHRGDRGEGHTLHGCSVPCRHCGCPPSHDHPHISHVGQQ